MARRGSRIELEEGKGNFVEWARRDGVRPMVHLLKRAGIPVATFKSSGNDYVSIPRILRHEAKRVLDKSIPAVHADDPINYLRAFAGLPPVSKLDRLAARRQKRLEHARKMLGRAEVDAANAEKRVQKWRRAVKRLEGPTQ